MFQPGKRRLARGLGQTEQQEEVGGTEETQQGFLSAWQNGVSMGTLWRTSTLYIHAIRKIIYQNNHGRFNPSFY